MQDNIHAQLSAPVLPFLKLEPCSTPEFDLNIFKLTLSSQKIIHSLQWLLHNNSGWKCGLAKTFP